jgi:hypothetical protein
MPREVVTGGSMLCLLLASVNEEWKLLWTFLYMDRFHTQIVTAFGRGN